MRYTILMESSNTFYSDVLPANNPDIPDRRTIDLVSEPAKMITLLALATFEGGEKKSFSEVATRANDLQGSTPIRAFTSQQVVGHCRTALFPAEFVEYGVSPRRQSHSNREPDRTVGLSERGDVDGLAIAGALLPLQLAVPWEGFLETTLGIRSDHRRNNARPLYYEALLEKPRGVTELSKIADITHAATSRHVSDLIATGVLEHTDLCDPANRTYRIADADYCDRSDTSPATLAVIGAAVYFRYRQQFVVNGEEFLARACEIAPDIPSQKMWNTFLEWTYRLAHRSGFVRLIDEPRAQKGEVRITDTYRHHIDRLLKIRTLLTADTGVAKLFRAISRNNARNIAAVPELINRALAYGADETVISSQKSDWLIIVEDMLAFKLAAGEKSIEAGDLHRLTVETLGRPLGFDYFCRRLAGSPHINVDYRIAAKHRNKFTRHISLKDVTLSEGQALAVESARMEYSLDAPQPFRPFFENDKIMWLTQAPDGHPQVVYIEACGATLEVRDIGAVVNLQGQQIELQPQEKLALCLLVMGANLDDIEAYCVERSELAVLMGRLGVKKENRLQYAKVAHWTCRTLLDQVVPATSPPPSEISLLKEYLVRGYLGQEEKAIGNRLSIENGLYTTENKPAWCGINLQILIAYADNLL